MLYYTRSIISNTILPELTFPVLHRLACTALSETITFGEKSRLRVRFTKRLQGRTRYHCSYNNRQYTLKSAYHTAKKGCAGHDVQKWESSRLKIARRSAGLPSSSLPSAPRSIAFPNNRLPLTSYHLEPPTSA